MGISTGTTEYILQHREVKISAGSQAPVICEKIELREPSIQHNNGFFTLKQRIRQAQRDAELAVMSMAANSSAFRQALDTIRSEKELSAGEEVQPLHLADMSGYAKDTEALEINVRNALESSEKVSLSDFVSLFGKLATLHADRRLAILHGEGVSRPMENGDWEKFHPEDQLAMAIRWCCFFVIPPESGKQPIAGGLNSSKSQPTLPTAEL